MFPFLGFILRYKLEMDNPEVTGKLAKNRRLSREIGRSKANGSLKIGLPEVFFHYTYFSLHFHFYLINFFLLKFNTSAANSYIIYPQSSKKQNNRVPWNWNFLKYFFDLSTCFLTVFFFYFFSFTLFTESHYISCFLLHYLSPYL